MARQPLPPRRPHVTQKFKIHFPNERGKNPTLFVTVGFKDEERRIPGEIKIVLSTTGSTERAYSDALSYAVSLGMQNGASLSDYVEEFIGTKFTPYGPCTGYRRIKFCSSPLDLAFRWLGIRYCGMDDLATVTTNQSQSTQDDDNE